jgi:sulfide:quinone oxidoreductase
LITGYDNVVMAEFDYSQQPISSFLVDPTRERWSMWLMKTKLLPWLYWNRMLKGLPHESRYLKPLAPLVRALRLDYREPKPEPIAEAKPAAAGTC